MPELANLWVGVGADTSEFQRGMKRVSTGMRDVGKKMSRVGGTMTKGLTLPVAGAAAGVVKMAADFQGAMNSVQAVTQPTAKQLKAMESQAKELGRTTQFSASEAAEGMKFLGQAGLSASQQMQALPKMLDLAAAGSLELGRASDIATDLTASFGLEVSEMGRVNDVLAETASSATTDVAKMAETMKQVAPVAKSSGISLEETSAAAGMLANAGIKGSQAGTQLRGAIAKMEAPSKAQKKAMDALGVSFTDAQGDTVGLIEAVRRMKDAGAGTGDVMEIFGRRAGTAMSALMEKGAPAIEEFQQKLEGAQGRAKEMAETRMQGLPGMLKRLKSAFEGMALAIADAGVVDFFVKVAEKVRSFMQAIAEANPTVLKIGVVIAGVVAAAGPLLAALGFITSGIGALGAALAAISAPVAAVVAGIAALVAGVIIAYRESETFRSIVQSAFAAIKTAISTAITVARKVIAKFISWAKAAWARWGGDIREIATRAWNIVSHEIERVTASIKTIISAATTAIEAIWNRWGSTIMSFARRTWNNIKTIIAGAMDIILGTINAILATLQGDWSGAWESIKQVGSGIWQVIEGMVGQLMNTLGRLVVAGLTALREEWDRQWQRAEDFVSDVVDAVVGFITSLPGRAREALASAWSAYFSFHKAKWNEARDWVSDRLDDVVGFVGDLPGDARGALSGAWATLQSFWRDVFREARDFVSDRVDDVIGFFRDLPDDIVNVLGDLGSTLVTAGRDLIKGLAEGISGAGDAVVKAVKNAFSDAWDAVSGIIPGVGGAGDGPGFGVPSVGGGGNAMARAQKAMQGLPLAVTSTYRTPAENAAAGGSPTSYHLDKSNPAVDFSGPMWAMRVAWERLQAMGARHREMLGPWNDPAHGDHLHLAHSGGMVTRQGIEPLRGDEIAAKLQVGETVLPRGTSSRGGGDGDGQAEVVAAIRRNTEEIAALREDVSERPTRAEVRDAVRAG